MVFREGFLVNKNLKSKQESLAEYQPGDKLYQLFKHKQAIVNGHQEKFLIKIEKIS